MSESPGDAYDRGHAAGGVDALLAEHSQHLAKINGHIGRVAVELAGVREGLQIQALATQRLADEATAAAKAVVIVAAALKDARERSWAPWAKLLAALAGAAALVAIIAWAVAR